MYVLLSTRSTPGDRVPRTRRGVLLAAVVALCLSLGLPAPATAQNPAAGGTSRFVTVNGIRLHYLEWGTRNSRPTLVLLHPAPLNARVWSEFAATMAGDYHVIAPDARGFGDSAHSGSYDDDVFIEDVGGLLKAIGATRVILCGNSMGGTLAYAFASLHPEVVERLILVDTGPGEKPDEAGAATGAGGTASGPPPGPPRGGPPPVSPGPFATRDEASAGVPPVFGLAFTKAMVEHNLRQDSDGRFHWKYDPAVLIAGQRSMRDPRKWPRWLAVRCPTLVLRGERSPAMSQRAAEQMVAENRHATLVVVPRAGHFVPLDEPAAFAAAVRAWLQP